jgi:hypothetical protein
MLFQTLGRPEILEIWNLESSDTFVHLEIGKFVPKKHVLQNTLRSRYLEFWEIGTFSDIFFRNVTNLQKKRKTQNAKRPENT